MSERGRLSVCEWASELTGERASEVEQRATAADADPMGSLAMGQMVVLIAVVVVVLACRTVEPRKWALRLLAPSLFPSLPLTRRDRWPFYFVGISLLVCVHFGGLGIVHRIVLE